MLMEYVHNKISVLQHRFYDNPSFSLCDIQAALWPEGNLKKTHRKPDLNLW